MNSVQLVGRFTKDPELRYGADNKIAVARFNLAVDRRFKNEKDNQNADFISCIAFNKTAEFVNKYFAKGQRIGLTGRIQTGSYKNKDNQTVYTTDVIAEQVEFVESKSDSMGYAGNSDSDDFLRVPDNVEDEGLPFN